MDPGPRSGARAWPPRRPRQAPWSPPHAEHRLTHRPQLFPAEATLLDCPLGEWGAEVPQEVKDAVAAVAAQLESGEVVVYTGPLMDNQGNEVVADGATIDAAGAYSVNFALEGVTGS
jgi:hypothetical protein